MSRRRKNKDRTLTLAACCAAALGREIGPDEAVQLMDRWRAYTGSCQQQDPIEFTLSNQVNFKTWLRFKVLQ